MTEPITILGISGSLRVGSYNTAALSTAADLAPDGVTVVQHPLDDIPLYNFDVENRDGFPAPVVEFRAAIAAADAVLFACPEYNFSVTGVLKNAIDWASRHPDSPLDHKQAAILGVGGRFGTLRAQLHLSDILSHNRMRVSTPPTVMIARPTNEFDAEHKVVTERSRDQIKRLIEHLADEVRRDRMVAGLTHTGE